MISGSRSSAVRQRGFWVLLPERSVLARPGGCTGRANHGAICKTRQTEPDEDETGNTALLLPAAALLRFPDSSRPLSAPIQPAGHEPNHR
jgi:hypothetical protein